jgi:hypothetical protein
LPRLSTWLLVALAGGALISGCGSSETTTTVTTASTGVSSAPTNTAGAPARSTTLPHTASLPATAPASPTTTSPTTTPPTTVPKAVPQSPQKIAGKQAVSVCKGAVRAQPTLSASTKANLEQSCEKAAAGGQSALQRVAHEVCLEIINSANVPAGAAREHAVATCGQE